MTKAVQALTFLYPKMINFTFIEHAFHRVAEVVKGNYPKVDLFISSVEKLLSKLPVKFIFWKKCTLKFSSHINQFLLWGLQAVEYYVKHKNVLYVMDSEKAASIEAAKTVVRDTSVINDLSYFEFTFPCITGVLKSLHAFLTLWKFWNCE